MNSIDAALYRAAEARVRDRRYVLEQNTGCQRGCQVGDHRHASQRQGPFKICSCLECPTLVH